MELDPQNWVVLHKEGSRHKNADALSRRPVTPDMKDSETAVGVVRDVRVVYTAPSDNDMSCSTETAEIPEKEVLSNLFLSPDNILSMFDLLYDAADIVTMQQNDPDVDTVQHWVEQSRRPSGDNWQVHLRICINTGLSLIVSP